MGWNGLRNGLDNMRMSLFSFKMGLSKEGMCQMPVFELKPELKCYKDVV